MVTKAPTGVVNVAREVAALQRMTVKQLRAKFAEVFGEPTSTGNKVWLVRRVAWRLQVLAEGDLSDRAKARDADLRLIPPPDRPSLTAASAPTASRPRGSAFAADARLPPPGTVLTRKYKGGVVQVTVRPDGFEYDGQLYPSLSAAANPSTAMADAKSKPGEQVQRWRFHSMT